MIDVTTLFCGSESASDALRYGSTSAGPKAEFVLQKRAEERRPVVVWNCTRTCNLACVHCYADSEAKQYKGELRLDEAYDLIEDLAAFNVPALLLSGGEPLVRPDIMEIITYARKKGLKITISTNGTRIFPETARKLKELGVSYVGISFDGLGEINDQFRGVKGAYKAALSGMHNCQAVGQKVGLRFTLTRRNYEALDSIFDFIEREKIPRACFYHLVYAGRGSNMRQDDLSHQETRQALDIILKRTEDFVRRGVSAQILTVDNHVDGVYLYLKLKKKDPELAEKSRKLIEWNGGGANSSGIGIANIDTQGYVHPDQFWQEKQLGNVRFLKFSEIWQDPSNELLKELRNRLPLLKGKCRDCAYLKMCGGSFRARADKVYGDPWAPDPACYLTDEEIGLKATAARY